RAQAPGPSPLPLAEVLRDANGDEVPDLDGETVLTGGRVSTGVMGQEDGWKDFFLQSGLAGIDVVVPAPVPVPALGDSVVVSGSLEFEGGMVLIVNSIVRIEAAAPLVPAPMPLDVQDAEVLKAHRGRLVTMTGTVVGRSSEDGHAQLLLYPDAGDAIAVFVPRVRVRAFDLDAFTPGTRLRVTGVLGQHDDEAPYDEGFILYPRTQADFDRVGLSAAFYQHTRFSGLLFALVAGSWAFTLRRQVRRKTKSLSESKRALQRELAQRKEAEEALRHYVVRLDQAQHIAGLGYWEWDIRSRLIHCSDEYIRLFGYEPGAVEPTMEWFLSHMAPEEEAGFVAVLESAHAGASCEVEYRIMRA